MKMFPTIAAIAFVLFLAAWAGASAVLTAHVSRGLQEGEDFLAETDSHTPEAEAFYDATLPPILSEPTAEKIEQAWAAGNRESLKRRGVDEFISRIDTKLGAFKRCDDVMFDVSSEFEADEKLFHESTKTRVSAKVSALCKFSKGSVLTTMDIEKAEDVWGVTALALSDDMRLPAH